LELVHNTAYLGRHAPEKQFDFWPKKFVSIGVVYFERLKLTIASTISTEAKVAATRAKCGSIADLIARELRTAVAVETWTTRDWSSSLASTAF
jgi:hypothetical protein